MLIFCPDCRREFEDERFKSPRTSPHQDYLVFPRCPECLTIRMEKMRVRTEIPSPSEFPRPEGFYRSGTAAERPSKRLPPFPKEVRKEINKPTPPGVLASQPDGLTFRQRAANKSNQ